VVESDTGNWILKPGHSRPTAASIDNLQSTIGDPKCLRMWSAVIGALRRQLVTGSPFLQPSARYV
jgi:hypothetical protein